MKGKLCLVSLALCLLLTGCGSLPTGREMGDMALLRTMGVDSAPAGVAVTVSTGLRAKGIQGDEEPALVLSAQKESLSAACLSIQSLSDRYVFYGYVDQLLLGEELAKGDVVPVLDYFARDVELGLGAQLWLVRGNTAQAAVDAGGEDGVEQRLSTLQTDGEMGAAAISRTAGEVYTDLLERGAAFAPAVAPTGDGNATLVETGYGVLKDGALVGFLEGEPARGLELLASRTSAEILTVQLPETRVSVRMTRASTRPSLEFQGARPARLRLSCRVEVELVEYDRQLDHAELELLQAKLEERMTARLEETLAQLREWQADCVGLGPRAALALAGKWQAVQGDWPAWFERTEQVLTVQVAVCD